jgi:NADH-ubiquinone oxidoreductase chain 4
MLLAILFILSQTGSTNLQILLTTEFNEQRQVLLWIFFCFLFCKNAYDT